jgi:hypothetical protein
MIGPAKVRFSRQLHTACQPRRIHNQTKRHESGDLRSRGFNPDGCVQHDTQALLPNKGRQKEAEVLQCHTVRAARCAAIPERQKAQEPVVRASAKTAALL